MQRPIRRYKHIPWPWLLTWIAIYLSFMSLGLFYPDCPTVTYIKFLGLTLNLVFVLKYAHHDHFLVTALIATLAADVFLITPKTLSTGVLLFCAAQFCHFLRLRSNLSVTKAIYLLYPAAAVYAFLLLSNVLAAKHYTRAAFIGFLLFLCCDFFVGCSYLASQALIPTTLVPLFNYLDWAFYYPAQVFLANSSKSVLK